MLALKLCNYSYHQGGHRVKPFNLDIDMYKAKYDLKLQSWKS